MRALVVEAPGFLTTVQDPGRPGFAALGVSAAGAAYPIALAAGNRLVGNRPEAAALEMTLVGGRFRLLADAVVALTGADPAARVGTRTLQTWTACAVASGDTIACGPLAGGARAYLCVRGGFELPRPFGSASTHLASRLGGLEGRALRGGDRLPIGDRAAADPLSRPIDPASIPAYLPLGALRVTWGVQADEFPEPSRSLFTGTDWTVSEACDRMGIRLDGPPIPRLAGDEMLTEGVTLGSVQVPADGKPIVLFVDHQTTGGYPKIASVIAADAARLGQLRPRDTLRFSVVTLEAARILLSRQDAALREIVRG